MRLKNFTLLLFLAAIFMTSCQEDSQTEFSISDLNCVATLQGTVVYDTGADPDSDDYSIIQNTPATGRKVYVATALSSYGDENAEGDNVVETVVDSLGCFSIDVPIPYVGAYVTVTLEDFTANYSTYLGVSNGAAVYESVLCQFTTPSSLSKIALVPDQTYIMSEVIKYDSTPLDLTQYSDTATIQGNIQLAVESSYRIGDFTAAANKSIEIEVEILGVDTDDNSETLTFGATTDNNGDFELTIPLITRRDGFILNSVVMLETESTFSHYPSSSSSAITLTGSYAEKISNDFSNAESFTNLTDSEVCDLGTTYLFFVPGSVDGSDDYNNLTGSDGTLDSVTTDSYTNELAGWQAVNKAFEGYDYTVTVTGNVYLGRETSYGVGTYSTGITTVSVSLNNVNFVAPTSSSGAFSFEMPVADQTLVYGSATNVSLYRESSSLSYETENEPFVHYSAVGVTKSTYNGYFSQKGTKTTTGDKWYNLGNIYFTYTATGSAATELGDNYTSALAGWMINSYDNTATVSGSIYKAVETAYGVGEYAAVANEMVSVTVNNSGSSETYQVVTDASGTYSAVVGIKDGIVPSASVSYSPASILDFSHYSSATAEVASIEGSYTLQGTITPTGSSWYTMGSQYYTFTPSNANQISSSDWSSKFANLAGWSLNTNNYEYTKDISSKVMIAKEDSYAVGSYVAAEGRLASITVGGVKYVAPVAADGTISITAPIEKENGEYAYTVALVDSEENNFVNYKYTGDTKLTYGEYSSLYATIEDKSASWNDKYTYYYKFVEDSAVTSSTYSNNLAGWVVIQDFDESQTVTGSISLPYETAFGVGAYQTPDDGIAVISIYYAGTVEFKEFAVPVANDGSFTLEAPVFSTNIDYTVSGVTYKSNETNYFVHYKAPGVAVNLYADETNSYTTSYTINKVGAEWYEAGDRYLTFDPTASTKNTGSAQENWSANLAGWTSVAVRAAASTAGVDYDAVETITGEVQMAVEESYGVGTYTPLTDKLVNVTVGISSDNIYSTSRSFVVPVDADGKYSLEIPVQEAGKSYTATPTISHGIISNEFDYTKYTAIGKSEVVSKSTNYSYYTNLRDTDAEWTDRGVVYYKNSDAKHSDLMGWYVNPDKRYSEEVTGKLMFAKEESYMVGTYEAAAAGALVNVTYDSQTVTVVTDANGEYTAAAYFANEWNSLGEDPTIAVDLTEAVEVKDFVNYAQYPEQYVTDIVGATPKSTTFLIDGTYASGATAVNQKSDSYNAGINYFKFTADTTDSDYTTSNGLGAYHDDLVGYQVLTDSDLQTTITYTGSILLGVETSYLAAEYVAASNTVVNLTYTNPYGVTTPVSVPVDASGSFSATLPILKANSDGKDNNVTIASVTGTGKYVNYTSLTAKSESSNYTWTTVENIPGTAWNELGTTYFMNSVIGTTNYLAGLRIKKSTDTEITYTGGKVMFPVQNSYRTGAYVEHTGIFEMYITDAYGSETDGSRTYRILTDADGSYSYTQYLPTEQVSKQSSEVMVEAAVRYLDNGEVNPTTDSFTHYSNIDGSTFTLTGGYYHNSTIYYDSSMKQVDAQVAGSTTLPTFYYLFAPDLTSLTTAEQAIVDWYGKSNYFASLSGWETPMVDASANNLKMSLDIYQTSVSYTNSTATAAWSKFAYENVTVSMNVASTTKSYYTTTGAGTISLSIPIAETSGNANVDNMVVTIEDTAEYEFVAYDKLAVDDGVYPVKTYVDGTWSSTATLTTNAFVYDTSNTTSLTVSYTDNDSAKVYFTPTSSPSWWSIYDWSSLNIK
ncbi:MAG: hypothetical protein SNG34_02390 [Rikenellaceae bacterium]